MTQMILMFICDMFLRYFKKQQCDGDTGGRKQEDHPPGVRLLKPDDKVCGLQGPRGKLRL